MTEEITLGELARIITTDRLTIHYGQVKETITVNRAGYAKLKKYSRIPVRDMQPTGIGVLAVWLDIAQTLL